MISGTTKKKTSDDCEIYVHLEIYHFPMKSLQNGYSL